jgi:membrane-associated protein
VTNISNLLLTAVLNYGAIALAATLLLGAAGIPLPTTLLVIAGGAFVRQGLLDPLLAAVLGLGGAVIGDSVNYGIGRIAGGWGERRWGDSGLWKQGQGYFEKYGGLSIYLTRFLFASLAYPVNLAAGTTGYAYRRFLLMVILGEATWIVLFGVLGYAFGSQWELVSQFISDFGWLLVGIVALLVGLFLAVRWLLRR